MQVFKSRFTPGATGDEVHLVQGEEVSVYRKGCDELLLVTIDSERMAHDKCLNMGYEVKDKKDGNRFFIDGKAIVKWAGREEANGST